VTATVCFVGLRDKAVNQIMKAINFEDIGARSIEIILRNEARMGTQLTGIVEKGQAEDG
jgi:hypothetical protein